MNRAAIIILAFALAGCQTPTVKQVETIEVRVPVAVQPLRPDQVPEPPAPLPKRPDNISAALDVLLAHYCRMVAYVVQADPLLRISAGENPRTLPDYKECDGR